MNVSSANPGRFSIDKKLTICSGVIPLDKFFIETNWRWVMELNDHKEWEWVVAVDNDEGSCREEKIVAFGDERLHLVPVEGEDTKLASVKGANYHHAAAIEKVLKFIKTRFVLFLDPDFYIVEPNWIEKVIGHMTENDLAFFGAPWHPRWYMKYRYFPCVHCLFIDLDQISLEHLNFMPDTTPKENSLNPMDTETQRPNGLRQQIRQHAPAFIRLTAQYLWWNVVNRTAIGKGADTGAEIFFKYGSGGNFKSECLIPVFRPSFDFMGPRYVLTGFNEFVEKLLPDRWCYLPRDRYSYTLRGFQESGCPDVSQAGWEEFMWRREPFGFHIRRYPKRENNPDEQKRILMNTLETFGGRNRKNESINRWPGQHRTAAR